MALRIEVDHENIAEFCGRNGICRLSFCGSVLRVDFLTPQELSKYFRDEVLSKAEEEDVA